MKKKLSLLIITVVTLLFIVSCKKDSGPKDYSTSIKDKTWSGEFTYTGNSPESYSIHFNTDKTLLWSQLSGDYAGTWAVNGKQLTLSFASNGVEIKADITDDNMLTNISDNTGYYEINSGILIEKPNQLLDNTVWKGYLGISTDIQFSFLPGYKVEIKQGITPLGQYSYTRSASGADIRFIIGGNYFGVLKSSNVMKGSSSISLGYRWEVTKQ